MEQQDSVNQTSASGVCTVPGEPEYLPRIVAWYHPTNPNGVINAAQYPHVLEKNKVGYVACIVNPVWVHILTYEVKDSLTQQWSKCRAVHANYDNAKRLADSLTSPTFRNVKVCGSKLFA